MFDEPSVPQPAERDDVTADGAAPEPGRSLPAAQRPQPSDARHAEALLAQVPPPPSTREIGAAPLPADHPNPTVVRTDDDGGAWVDVLDQVSGRRLLAELLDADPGSLGDLDLVATLAAWERVSSWVAARHNEALAALLARAGRLGGLPETAAILATEVGYTQRAAQDKLAFANTLGTFPAVAEALEAGTVDVAKARAICDEALKAPEASAQQVAALGLALAPRKTPPQLRRALRAAVIGLDPDAAAERAEQERAERRVEFRPLPDAMAMITAYLPAIDAMAVKTALDALARTTGTEDPRTFDQRRADYLGAIFHAICDAGEAPLGQHPQVARASDGTDSERADDVTGEQHGEAFRPAHLGNPTDAQRSGAHRPAHLDDSTDAQRREAPRPAHLRNPTDAQRREAPRPGHILWRRLATNQRQRPHLQVTVAAATLLGQDDRPGDLTGYGPVPADVARLIASDATWRALYTDRAGAVTAVGERTYRPGAVLARQVAARDRTCTFTGCSRPAVQCDIDHRVAFTSNLPAAEQTRLDNLHALCRFHHNLKTLHGWEPEHDPRTGITTWTSPLGTRHERDAEPPLPPWESWLEDLDRRRPSSPCPCASPHRETEPALPDAGRSETGKSEPGAPQRPERAPGEPASGKSGPRKSEPGKSAPGESASDPPPPF